MRIQKHLETSTFSRQLGKAMQALVRISLSSMASGYSLHRTTTTNQAKKSFFELNQTLHTPKSGLVYLSKRPHRTLIRKWPTVQWLIVPGMQIFYSCHISWEAALKRRSKAPCVTANPFALWAGLAMKTGEMMLASAQVINHRTGRMAAAGPSPNARDRREFTLMGQEKLAAATESAQAVATRMLNLNQQMGTIAFNQLVAGTAGIMSVAAARTIAQSSKAQAELVRDTVSSSAKAASQLADSVARAAHHGLKPVHSRATANAKRLAKHKK
jgi:hypothetical protein